MDNIIRRGKLQLDYRSKIIASRLQGTTQIKGRRTVLSGSIFQDATIVQSKIIDSHVDKSRIRESALYNANVQYGVLDRVTVNGALIRDSDLMDLVSVYGNSVIKNSVLIDGVTVEGSTIKHSEIDGASVIIGAKID